MSYSTLLFDADGTLLDFDQSERDALRRCVAAIAPDEARTDELVKAYHEINKSLWILFEKGDISTSQLRLRRFEELVSRFALPIAPKEAGERYAELLSSTDFLIDGAVDLLESVAKRYTLILVTNGFSAVQRPRLAASGIVDFFDDIIISEEVGTRKPNPAIFELAISAAGITNKSEALMIGDSLSSDIAGGAAFGIDTCLFLPTGGDRDALDPQPTFIIRRLDELYGVLASRYA